MQYSIIVKHPTLVSMYCLKDMKDWCFTNIGEELVHWSCLTTVFDSEFKFINVSDAIQFKLVFNDHLS